MQDLEMRDQIAGLENASNIVFIVCHKTGHRRNQCPMNRSTHKTAAMHQLNNDYSHTKPHQCDNAQCEGQIKLACGCMLPVVAGAMSPNGQNKLFSTSDISVIVTSVFNFYINHHYLAVTMTH